MTDSTTSDDVASVDMDMESVDMDATRMDGRLNANPMIQEGKAAPSHLADDIPPEDLEGMLMDANQRFRTRSHWRNNHCACLFLTQLALVSLGLMWCLVAYGPQSEWYQKGFRHYNGGVNWSPDATSLGFWMMVAGVVGSSVGASMLLLPLLKRFAATMIKVALLLMVIVPLSFGIYTMTRPAPVDTSVGLVAIIWGLLTAVYAYLVRRRIAFAAAMLSLSAGVVSDNKRILTYAFAGVAAQIAWVALGVLGVLSFVNASPAIESRKTNNNTKQVRTILRNLLLVLLYWTQQVIANVVNVTTMGTVAAWYFKQDGSTKPKDATDAFKRASTTSLGSVALGSAVVVIIKALRSLFTYFRSSGQNNISFCCAECALNLLDRAVQFFNKYAYVQVAVYGRPLKEAGKATWTLFKHRGFDLVITDDLTGTATTLLSCVFLVAIAMLTGVIVDAADIVGRSAYMLIAGLCALLTLNTILSTVTAGCATIFVCYAEDPATLAHTKPSAHAKIVEAMEEPYPQLAAKMTSQI
jgi:hypothetical protein